MPTPRAVLVFLAKAIPLLLLASGSPAASSIQSEDQLTSLKAERLAMVRHQIASRDVEDPQVLKVMAEVPRHRFVPSSLRRSAYADSPLSIGLGQTISQPYIVAKMTELLRLEPNHVLFELGTGSGYQAAVASRLVDHVYTMEIHGELAERATAALKDVGYDNVSVRHGDGYYGWPEEGPFDAIIVTAAATHVPPPLLQQLKPGGRMILPVGPAFSVQRLVLVLKSMTGEISTEALFPVRFVPVTGEH